MPMLLPFFLVNPQSFSPAKASKYCRERNFRMSSMLRNLTTVENLREG